MLVLRYLTLADFYRQGPVNNWATWFIWIYEAARKCCYFHFTRLHPNVFIFCPISTCQAEFQEVSEKVFWNLVQIPDWLQVWFPIQKIRILETPKEWKNFGYKWSNSEARFFSSDALLLFWSMATAISRKELCLWLARWQLPELYCFAYMVEGKDGDLWTLQIFFGTPVSNLQNLYGWGKKNRLVI